MIAEYIEAAIHQAVYQELPEGSIIGEIPNLPGVSAQGETLLDCRAHLLEVLEDWIFFHVSRQLPVPPIAGVEVPIKDNFDA
jgi:predicted RNase H-like HicB family nuclease